jgi:hypothetical protein
MTEPTYPAFQEAHPPLMTNADVFPPHRSDYGVIGTMEIKGADMNRVTDPKYPWRNYANRSEPPFRAKVKEILTNRNADVESYLVTRRQYWEMVNRYEYGVDTEVTITVHRGRTTHRSHTVDQSHTVTERIAADLNLDISPGGAAVPGVPGEIPPVVPAPMALARGDNGGGSTAGLHFSHEMTDTLHITDVDDRIFIDEKTDTKSQKFVGETTYIYWQMKEQCILQRKLKKDHSIDANPVSSVEFVTADHTDSCAKKGSGGDIH